MIEIYELAEKIYKDAVFLKRQKSNLLTWKKTRERWLSAIAEMRENTRSMEEMLDYSYSEEHFALIREMQEILDSCENELREKTYGYKSRSCMYMQAFHNLPRAFFSPENRMCITVAEARKYADFWLSHG